jgi:hypothetical protein
VGSLVAWVSRAIRVIRFIVKIIIRLRSMIRVIRLVVLKTRIGVVSYLS